MRSKTFEDRAWEARFETSFDLGRQMMAAIILRARRRASGLDETAETKIDAIAAEMRRRKEGSEANDKEGSEAILERSR